MAEDNTLRTTFNQAAADYNAIRPGYPASLFDDVVTLSEIPPGGQALEIGCGTGQATLPFAQRGYRIDCLDIGPDLLAIAAKNLRAYPNVHFEAASFEKWPVREGEYDLVYAATSFHWVPREIGYPKAALALKPGGALAVFSNLHPRPATGFYVDVQPFYRQYTPEMVDRSERPTTAVEIEAQAAYIRSTGLFSSVEVRTYPWSRTYSTAEYLQLLNTYSDHLALEEARRQRLYQAIAGLIDSHYDGRVERPYLTVLYLGKKPRASGIGRAK
jgi:SAM-dependent methyltransferase